MEQLRLVFKLSNHDVAVTHPINVKDFERFANIREVHAGIVLICDGTLLRTEQMEVVNVAVVAILAELKAGRDMINGVLYVEANRSLKFENLPISDNRTYATGIFYL